MTRQDFFKTAGRLGGRACMCGAAGSLGAALAGAQTQTRPGDTTPERAVKRLEFADVWVKRFFDSLDRTVDEGTRIKLMMLNGKTCLQDHIRETKREIERVPFEVWARTAAEKNKAQGLTVDGNVIHFRFESSAETGGAAKPGICLCSMAESKPAGLSATFCWCSVGYVKEIFERRFGRTVDVELLDSILKGGERCRFRITVL